ncbi:MAG: hypothetical protein D6753_01935, partial [Planctomycetota bacterium]
DPVAPLPAQLIRRFVEANPDRADLVLSVWFARFPQTAFANMDQAVGATPERARAPTVEQFLRQSLLAGLRVQPSLTTEWIGDHWSQLSSDTKLALIEPLTSNRQSMLALLAILERDSTDKELVNPNQLRKWIGAGDEEIVGAIQRIWGRIRIEEDKARKELVQQTLQRLRSGVHGSVARGAAVFRRVCSQCHRLHGVGFEVGPDIYGNGRGNLEQLVSNVLDPSLVIGEAFQAKTLLTVDGEVVTGLVAGEDAGYLRLKVQGGQILEFAKDDIELIKDSTKSLMPEGVEQQMTEQELIDLIAFLCVKDPIGSAGNELIPGTPPGLVQP